VSYGSRSCFARAHGSDGAAKPHGRKCRDVLSFRFFGSSSLGEWPWTNPVTRWWWARLGEWPWTNPITGWWWARLGEWPWTNPITRWWRARPGKWAWSYPIAGRRWALVLTAFCVK
jgi:hypothetical protein